MNYEIKKLTPAMEAKISSDDNSYIDLEITSPKAAVLLMDVLRWRREICPSKRFYNEVKGGGLLIRGCAEIAINDLNEVKLHFGNTWAIGTYIRVACGKTERIKAIKNKIAEELKRYWKSFHYSKDEEDMSIELLRASKLSTSTYSNQEYLKVNDEDVSEINGKKYLKVSFNEYRVLYEFFKGRDKEKSIDRYGRKAYNTMIGQRIEDQFLLSAIEIIKGEINTVIDEFNKNFNESMKEESKEVNEVRLKRNNDRKEMERIKNEKIAECQDRINELIKMSALTAEGGSTTEAVA